jgi:BirA family transcriptional regulator, biotin operon repressor / biotin---[acetyl-CoA-carboxylase] ligase
MAQTHLFTILDTVESTNNYAMGQVHAGLSTHGDAWFALEQSGGKGQREKKWESAKNENILMTIVVKPGRVLQGNQFLLSAVTANVCQQVLDNYNRAHTKIKWPNDIYFGDRKAGGILIENIIKGDEWYWSIIGIGININQMKFSLNVPNATSLRITTGKVHNQIDIAKNIQERLLFEINNLSENSKAFQLDMYNKNLYKKDTNVKLKKGNIVFETTVKHVNKYGDLITEDAMERHFKYGDVQWINDTGQLQL